MLRLHVLRLRSCLFLPTTSVSVCFLSDCLERAARVNRDGLNLATSTALGSLKKYAMSGSLGAISKADSSIGRGHLASGLRAGWASTRRRHGQMRNADSPCVAIGSSPSSACPHVRTSSLSPFSLRMLRFDNVTAGITSVSNVLPIVEARDVFVFV